MKTTTQTRRVEKPRTQTQTQTQTHTETTVWSALSTHTHEREAHTHTHTHTHTYTRARAPTSHQTPWRFERRRIPETHARATPPPRTRRARSHFITLQYSTLHYIIVHYIKLYYTHLEPPRAVLLGVVAAAALPPLAGDDARGEVDREREGPAHRAPLAEGPCDACARTSNKRVASGGGSACPSITRTNGQRQSCIPRPTRRHSFSYIYIHVVYMPTATATQRARRSAARSDTSQPRETNSRRSRARSSATVARERGRLRRSIVERNRRAGAQEREAGSAQVRRALGGERRRQPPLERAAGGVGPGARERGFGFG